MSKKTKKFYVVWNGILPGIYSDWRECKRQIDGFEGALYKSFSSKEEAEHAFSDTAWNYIGKKVESVRTAKKWTTDVLLDSVAVDAACSGNPGKMEYRGVLVRTGELLFRQGPFEGGTNNIGEFLALVHAMAWMMQKGVNLPIYSDSVTGISWVRKRKAKTLIQPTERNRAVFELVERAERWLNEHAEAHFRILKWDTETWGEIPADFGRK